MRPSVGSSAGWEHTGTTMTGPQLDQPLDEITMSSLSVPELMAIAVTPTTPTKMHEVQSSAKNIWNQHMLPAAMVVPVQGQKWS